MRDMLKSTIKHLESALSDGDEFMANSECMAIQTILTRLELMELWYEHPEDTNRPSRRAKEKG